MTYVISIDNYYNCWSNFLDKHVYPALETGREDTQSIVDEFLAFYNAVYNDALGDPRLVEFVSEEDALAFILRFS